MALKVCNIIYYNRYIEWIHLMVLSKGKKNLKHFHTVKPGKKRFPYLPYAQRLWGMKNKKFVTFISFSVTFLPSLYPFEYFVYCFYSPLKSNNDETKNIKWIP